MKLKLNHIKACDQIWDEMLPCKNGRRCSKCDQVIHDFRGKTDLEIAFTHAKSTEKVCGIYDDVNGSDILDQPMPKFRWRRYALTGALGALTSSLWAGSKVHQTLPKPNSFIETSVFETETRASIPDTSEQKPDSAFVIKGRISYASTEPVEGALVAIDDQLNYFFTDEDGRFELDATSALNSDDSITIYILHIGFARKEYVITRTLFNEKNEFHLDLVLEEQLEAIVFRVDKKYIPWHRRLRSRARRIFIRQKN